MYRRNIHVYIYTYIDTSMSGCTSQTLISLTDPRISLRYSYLSDRWPCEPMGLWHPYILTYIDTSIRCLSQIQISLSDVSLSDTDISLRLRAFALTKMHIRSRKLIAVVKQTWHYTMLCWKNNCAANKYSMCQNRHTHAPWNIPCEAIPATNT